MCTIVLRLSIVEVKGNFTGTKTIEYKVEKADLIYSAVWYNGMDEDTVRGMNGYAGYKTVTFKIKAQPINKTYYTEID